MGLPEDGAPRVETPAWLPHEREGAASCLHTWGCVLLRGALTDKDVASLRDAFGLGVGSTARKAGEVGRLLQGIDPNIQMGRYTVGRLHCLLRGSQTFEPLALAVHTALAPLVYAYFRNAGGGNHRCFLSEAQLVVADPCAESQAWYVNSAGGPGLTVVVPLARITADTGPYAMLPGTHVLLDANMSLRERVRTCLSTLCSTNGAVSVVDKTSSFAWEAGDALVLDGRMMHCALKNDSLGAPIPVLVLRYDLSESPPPGAGRFKLLSLCRVAAMLDSVFRLYSWV